VSRTRALALALLAVGALGAWRAMSTPDATAPDCAPEALHLDAQGAAVCGPGAALGAGQALTVGGRVDLQTASAADLALVPGISAALAERLVKARAERGGFASWDDVDRVEGVGPARLERLRRHGQLTALDAGL
jgi:competence protein ComEA